MAVMANLVGKAMVKSSVSISAALALDHDIHDLDMVGVNSALVDFIYRAT